MKQAGMVFALALSLVAGAAVAAPTTTESGQTEAARRALYICDGSSETRRALVRLHGSAEYVSAEEALAAQGWETPRCMKASEFRRLQSMLSKQVLVKTSAR
ncbi:MAG TPA: hypothetical protein VD906_04415 [Caulobacteraceae bacterium]|nr:hypothetical protein [Caulobacteraceae bacterium]